MTAEDRRLGQQAFTVRSATEDTVTARVRLRADSAGQDATLDLGGYGDSSTNTFDDLLAGASVTVSKADATPVTVTVWPPTPTPWPPRCRRWSTR